MLTKLTDDLSLNESDFVQIHNPEFEQILKSIEKYRIRSNTVLPDMRHLLQIGGIKCFPRGDLVAISGKEKCGKTTDCRIMVSALLKGEYMGVKALEKNVRILWIDTEQANLSSRAVCRGIELMCGFDLPEQRMLYYAFREYPDHGMFTLAMQALFDKYAPDIAIIDGIRDFIPDFNDVVESSEIVLQCMLLSSGVTAEKAKETGLNERPPCCVCCILHQNKPKDDTNMRGHLGTELSNKAGEVWEATQDDDHVFTFKQIRSRTRPLEEALNYKVQTRNYLDQNTGKVEEIGVPELWTMVPPTNYVKTNHGEYPLTQDTAFMMFYAVMKYSDWDFTELKKKFTSYWGVDYFAFNEIKALTDGHVKKGSNNKWKYDGPSYDI